MPKTTKVSGFTDREVREFIKIQRIMRKYDREATIAYAKKEGILQTAKCMLKDGLEPEHVARITKLPRKEVLALRRA